MRWVKPNEEIKPHSHNGWGLRRRMRRLIKHFLNTKAQRYRVANIAVGKYHEVTIAAGKTL
jgi:hypothetical protein